jgi:hypothetical protein
VQTPIQIDTTLRREETPTGLSYSAVRFRGNRTLVMQHIDHT